MENRPIRPTLAIIGAGGAGFAVGVAAKRVGYRVTAVYSRTKEKAERLSALLGAQGVESSEAAVARADLTLLALPDNQIKAIGEQIAKSPGGLVNKRLVHLAGSLNGDELSSLDKLGAEVGVLHPLQALVGAESADGLVGAFFRIEAEGRLRDELLALVASLDGQYFEIPRDKVGLYHAAAVLVGSGVIELLKMGVEALEEVGLEPKRAELALRVLMAGALSNTARLGLEMGESGPLARGDQGTLVANLEALQGLPRIMGVYQGLIGNAEVSNLASGTVGT